MTNAVIKTIVTTTTAGYTDLPTGFHLIQIINTDATNYVTISFKDAIGTTGNDEGVILAGSSIPNYANVRYEVVASRIYHKSNSANVSITLIGYIA